MSKHIVDRIDVTRAALSKPKKYTIPSDVYRRGLFCEMALQHQHQCRGSGGDAMVEEGREENKWLRDHAARAGCNVGWCQ